ncbi:ligand-binding sensor domain-containing protein [Kordia zhangzhouensis]|uniref:ligand-binding sensor domain-containing protein n=1 Tax=Kordia zhangzhouensis TaxID=1620405 RepID=UPI000628FC4D|nr:LytTR family transcriptional regulator DNA-binding domain-containing protein [Kordia zhangzhouensis]
MSCHCLFAQKSIYREFGINDGLPSLEVHGIYQDINGLIWFATDRGLANYNGYEIKSFSLEDSVSNAVVLDLFPQHNGVIYAATFNNQLFYFHESFQGFQPYPYNQLLSELLEFKQHIMSVYVDSEENLHIACEYMIGKLVISKDGKILKMPSKKKVEAKHDIWMNLQKINSSTLFFSFENDSLEKDKNTIVSKVKYAADTNVIFLKEAKNIVYADDNSLVILDTNGEQLNCIATTMPPIVLKALSSTTFFVGFEFGGGVIMDIQGKIIDRFFPNESITDFLIDHEGGYWFATLHSGIFYVKDSSIKIFETGLKSPVETLAKTRKNELYVGYRTGDVLKIAEDRSITSEAILKTNRKAFVEFDEAQEILYVKSGHTFYTKDKNNKKVYFDSIARTYFTKLSEPLNREMCISNQNGFIIAKEGLFDKVEMPYRVQDVIGLDYVYYVGTPLGAYTYKEGVTTPMVTTHPVFKYRIDDIDINEQRKEVYFATLGSGVIIYNPKTEKVQTIKAEDGLSSNIVNELYIENKDELWVCTNSGIDKVTFATDGTFHISGLKSSNGLLNDGINDVEVINDTVWIASIKGLTYVPKKWFHRSKKIAVDYLNVKACYVNDSVQQLSKLQQLSYKENRVEFVVEAISFKSSQDIVYKYQMEGLDHKWYFTKNRRISYPVLPYGTYTFKVTTTSPEYESARMIEIPIYIQPPFWRRAWFHISIIASIILLLYLFFKYRILSYNQHIIRELLRLWMKKIKRKEKYFTFKEAGKEIRIKTNTILYVKSAGNYIELCTEHKKYTIRKKIGEFISLTPDPLEYLRIHRSYIIRIDKVAEKNSKEVIINGEKIPVSNSYAAELSKLIF